MFSGLRATPADIAKQSSAGNEPTSPDHRQCFQRKMLRGGRPPASHSVSIDKNVCTSLGTLCFRFRHIGDCAGAAPFSRSIAGNAAAFARKPSIALLKDVCTESGGFGHRIAVSTLEGFSRRTKSFSAALFSDALRATLDPRYLTAAKKRKKKGGKRQGPRHPPATVTS